VAMITCRRFRLRCGASSTTFNSDGVRILLETVTGCHRLSPAGAPWWPCRHPGGTRVKSGHSGNTGCGLTTSRGAGVRDDDVPDFIVG
jgi:hypothetical protein